MYRHGEVVCRDVVTDDWLYVVKSGSCWVLRRLSVNTRGHTPPAISKTSHMTPVFVNLGRLTAGDTFVSNLPVYHLFACLFVSLFVYLLRNVISIVDRSLFTCRLQSTTRRRRRRLFSVASCIFVPYVVKCLVSL